jgi:hypothetical protein
MRSISYCLVHHMGTTQQSKNITYSFIVFSIILTRERLLLFSAEYFVLQFAIQNIKIKIYRNIIFPLVLYGCENWSLIMEEQKIRVRIGCWGQYFGL